MKIRKFFTLRLLLNIVGLIIIIITVLDASKGRSVLWRVVFLHDTRISPDASAEGNPTLFFIGIIVWLIIGISLFFMPAKSGETYQMRWQKLIQKFKKR
ncbi:MAG: hypothetical protein K0U45_09410 [Alphaproteobacteria bacterium]|nr:hypothetical protein [Alphaproteobacteria bacterium]